MVQLERLRKGAQHTFSFSACCKLGVGTHAREPTPYLSNPCSQAEMPVSLKMGGWGETYAHSPLKQVGSTKVEVYRLLMA